MNYGKHRRGFSLVEVNLAILLVAMGMLVLFGLFPSGLREGELAISDTQMSMFADFVLSGIEANAAKMTNWNTWRDIATPASFRNTVVSGVKPDGSSQVVAQAPPAGTVSGPMSFAGGKVKYILEIGGTDYRVAGTPPPQTRKVSLWVMSSEYATAIVSRFKPRAGYFYTELYYPGVGP